jgi:hypothetical protein
MRFVKLATSIGISASIAQRYNERAEETGCPLVTVEHLLDLFDHALDARLTSPGAASEAPR